jgi:hypothetical protein
MPIGTHHRVSGVLLASRRGPILQVDDGGVWAIDTHRSITAFLGQRVTVEGRRAGYDLLEIDWIGTADAR